MKKIALAALTSAALLVSSAADAATYLFTGANSDGTISGEFTISDVETATPGYYELLSAKVYKVHFSGSEYDWKTDEEVPYTVKAANLDFTVADYWSNLAYNPATKDAKGVMFDWDNWYAHLQSGDLIMSFDDLSNYAGLMFMAPVGSTTFRGEHLTITKLTSAVPEPAAWAMMIMGFGLAGASLRRRRAAQAFA